MDTASGVNRIIDKNGYQYIKQREDDWYKIKEGIFLMLIISMASSIEGSLRSFLNVSVNTASSKRQEFINFLSRVDIDPSKSNNARITFSTKPGSAFPLFLDTCLIHSGLND